MASEPRVTRFKINWEEPNQNENNTNTTESSNHQSNGNLIGSGAADNGGETIETTTSNQGIDVPTLNENSNSWATMECS